MNRNETLCVRRSAEIVKAYERSKRRGQKKNQFNRQKILYTTADADPQSGAYRSLLYMSREIKKRGYDSILVLPQENTPPALLLDEERNQVYMLRFPRPRLHQSLRYHFNYFRYNAQSVYRYVDIIRKEHVSIVHVNEVLDLSAAVAARIARVPCVCHIRAFLPFPFIVKQGFPRLAVLLSNAIICVSGSVYENIFLRQGIDTSKVLIIHNPGPDPNQFHPGVNGDSIRKEFNLDKDTFLVTLVGALHEWKGHAVLIRAAPNVLASFPNTRFMIVGGEIRGVHHAEYAARLKDLPCELVIQEKVIFTGYRTDIPQIMAASDIVPFCSIIPDPFPGVVLQGMSVGKPVIASNIGGAKEQIENGVSGLLVEPGNPTALSEAICYLLQNKAERARLGEAAARRVRSTFKSDVFFGKLSNLYDDLISGN